MRAPPPLVYLKSIQYDFELEKGRRFGGTNKSNYTTINSAEY